MPRISDHQEARDRTTLSLKGYNNRMGEKKVINNDKYLSLMSTGSQQQAAKKPQPCLILLVIPNNLVSLRGGEWAALTYAVFCKSQIHAGTADVIAASCLD